MEVTRDNSEHYTWGDDCSGWHLVKSKNLSIIEEHMPSKTQEKKHYHKKAAQFFRILKGTATFEIEDDLIKIREGAGIYIPKNTLHKIRNDTAHSLKFLVISAPTTQGDRYNSLESS